MAGFTLVTDGGAAVVKQGTVFCWRPPEAEDELIKGMPLNHGIYSQELSSYGQFMHFGCAAEYRRQNCISIMMSHGIIIGTTVGTVNSYCFR